MQPSNICEYCGKPYAYALPYGNWYRPPLHPTWWTTVTDHTTNLIYTGTANTQPHLNPLDYCYGHTFVQCADCGLLVPYGLHTPQACALLRGMMEGLRQVATHIERQETMPASERLDVPVEVPDVFQQAFADKEML